MRCRVIDTRFGGIIPKLNCAYDAFFTFLTDTIHEYEEGKGYIYEVTQSLPYKDHLFGSYDDDALPPTMELQANVITKGLLVDLKTFEPERLVIDDDNVKLTAVELIDTLELMLENAKQLNGGEIPYYIELAWN